MPQFETINLKGKFYKVVPKRGQLLVCSLGCCCGNAEKGYNQTLAELYNYEWERRKLRNKLHLSESGCLGPCKLGNVVLLLLDGRPTWFHSIESKAHVLAIYDYIEAILVAGEDLPPVPTILASHVFRGFTWGT